MTKKYRLYKACKHLFHYETVKHPTNSVMMPIAAVATCLLVLRVIGTDRIAGEVEKNGAPFKRRKIFEFMIRYLCIIFVSIILLSSVASVLGWITM